VAALCNVIRVGIVDEILDLLALLFFITLLILIVDLGLDIEEGIASVTAPFTPMTLGCVNEISG
jgi:hypothetical protein